MLSKKLHIKNTVLKKVYEFKWAFQHRYIAHASAVAFGMNQFLPISWQYKYNVATGKTIAAYHNTCVHNEHKNSAIICNKTVVVLKS